MDFTQHNKINSGLASRYQSHQPAMQNFLRSVPPKFQQPIPDFQGASGRERFNGVNPEMCNRGGMSRNFMQNQSSKQPYGHGTYSVSTPHHTLDSVTPPADMCFQDCEDDGMGNQEDLEIEYFQCTPTPSKTNKQRDPFMTVMQSMQNYSKSQVNHKPRPVNDINHQMFCYSHESVNDMGGEQQQLEVSPQKLYRSHTKIEAIPCGVRIITEILKAENEEDDEEISACPSRHTQTEDKWLNKKIDVTVKQNDEEEDDAD